MKLFCRFIREFFRGNYNFGVSLSKIISLLFLLLVLQSYSWNGRGVSWCWKKYKYKIVAEVDRFISQAKREENIFSSKEFIDNTLFRKGKERKDNVGIKAFK
jgi:hypothetical protein